MHESNGVVHKLTALFCAKFSRPFEDEHEDETLVAAPLLCDQCRLYLSAGTTIEIALPGLVSRTNRRVSTVAAVKSPRANPIQMPVAPALRTNARKYAAGMATPQ